MPIFEFSTHPFVWLFTILFGVPIFIDFIFPKLRDMINGKCFIHIYKKIEYDKYGNDHRMECIRCKDIDYHQANNHRYGKRK